MGEQVFKGIDLNSEGHARLCEALESEGLLFCFEVNTCVPDGEAGLRRTLDLLVITPVAVLNVEIDGARHNKTKRRDKDYSRDRLLSRSSRSSSRRSSRDRLLSLDRLLSPPGGVAGGVLSGEGGWATGSEG